MFLEDIKNDFYNVLLGNRVLLLVHYDVDAICTCRILQNLFKADNISYTLVPVGSISELKTAYEENHEEIKYVVLVNCGGTIDLVDILQPDEDVVFFVLDSHKPTDVCNVYSDGQVRLIWKDEEENIPNFDDVFKDEEEDDEEDENIRDVEAVVTRRRERRAWEEKRNTLMFNYTQFSYYGKPSACIALELSWRLSRLTCAALWAACVSWSASAALCTRSPEQCLLDADALQRHVASGLNSTDETHHTARVSLEKDAWLPLYRLWSLESGVRFSPALAPRLRLHTLAGDARVRQLLAAMGFPLQQARQAYRSMEVSLRRSLVTSLESACAKLAPAPHSSASPSASPSASSSASPSLAPSRAAFLLRRALRPPLAAHDLVYVLLALIEHETIPAAEGFQRALSVLKPTVEPEELHSAVIVAQKNLAAISRIIYNTLSSKSLHLAGPFNYFIIQEGSAESLAVLGPHWLGVCARWAALAGAGAGAGAGARGGAWARPLLAAVALPGARSLLLGLPPRHDQEPRNLFGAAFEQAAARCGCTVSLDYLDSSVVILPTSQRTQFLDALTHLLS